MFLLIIINSLCSAALNLLTLRALLKMLLLRRCQALGENPSADRKALLFVQNTAAPETLRTYRLNDRQVRLRGHHPEAFPTLADLRPTRRQQRDVRCRG